MNNTLSSGVIFPLLFVPEMAANIFTSPLQIHTLLKAHYWKQQYYQLQTFSFPIYSPERFSLQNKWETHHGSHLFYFCLTKFNCCEEFICEIYHSKNDCFLVICRCIELNVKETDNPETKEIKHRGGEKPTLVRWNSYWCQQRWVRIIIAILLQVITLSR